MRLTAVFSLLTATALLPLATVQSSSPEQAKPGPPASALAENSWTDGRVTLVVEKVERGPDLSPGTRQKWFPVPDGLKKPWPGNELLAIHTIFQRINGVYVTSLGPSTLFDTEGRKYEPWSSSVRGVRYLAGSFTSPHWVVAGAVAVSVFEIPKAAIPRRLTFAYHCKAGWDQVSEDKWNALTEETGRVDIDLRQLRPAASSSDSRGIEFVDVPAGKFKRWGLTHPLEAGREVSMSGFQMGKYEVTQRQWEAVMRSNPSHFRGDQLPVENVTNQEVVEFLDGLNKLRDGYRYRLPTADEWEYAARAGTNDRAYGLRIDDIAWHAGNSGMKTHPVGLKQANAWGLHDVAGNVMERCGEPGSSGFYASLGSCWDAGAQQSGIAVIDGASVDGRSPCIGVRVVRERIDPTAR